MSLSPKITPLNITYWCLVGDKTSHSSPSNCVTAHSLVGEEEEQEEEFKGIVHPKVKFDPFAPYHYDETLETFLNPCNPSGVSQTERIPPAKAIDRQPSVQPNLTQNSHVGTKNIHCRLWAPKKLVTARHSCWCLHAPGRIAARLLL